MAGNILNNRNVNSFTDCHHNFLVVELWLVKLVAFMKTFATSDGYETREIFVGNTLQKQGRKKPGGTWQTLASWSIT